MSSRIKTGYLVALLTLAATLSFIDRQILAVMIGPIKRDLGGLSDTQISLIIGLAFSLVYSIATLPLARIADRYNRRNLIAAGIFGWSAMTSLAGMASSFWQLFLARMGVGIGEASLGPATTSLLADYLPEARLPLAYGIVATAPFVGSGLASLMGGPLVDYLEAQPEIVLPGLGVLYSWQAVLIAVGAPGLILAALVFTVREPARHAGVSEPDSGYGYAELWQFVRARRTYLSLHFTAYLCLSVQGFAFLTWIVEFFVRKHDWSRTEIGITYGLIAMIVGVLGSVWAGYIAGRMIAAGRPDASMRLTFWGTLGLGPIAVLMPLLDSDTLAVALLLPITFFMSMPVGLSNAALQAIAPNRMRAQLIAIYMISVSFLSYLLAPLIIGLSNDYVFQRENAIDLSLSSLAAANYSVAAVCLGLSLGPLRNALRDAATWRPGLTPRARAELKSS